MDIRPNMLAAALLSFTLVACGGGGGGNDNSPPTPSPETPTGSSGDSGTLDHATYTGDKLAAFEAINAARAQAGLAPVKQNTKLDTAAQGHAHYQVLNGEGGHYQTEGKPGFTGQDPWERISNAGYEGQGSNTELAGAGYLNEGSNPDLGYRNIMSYLSTVYHRVSLLSAETIDVGIGLEIVPASRFDTVADYSISVINSGTTASSKHIPNATGYWVWPYDGASGLGVSYNEDPNPAPDLPRLGHAVSVTVNPGDTITAEVFTLNCAGHDLPARLITAANDIHERVKSNWVFLQPEVVLPYDATCIATFQGSSEKLGRFNKIWNFTTEPAFVLPAP